MQGRGGLVRINAHAVHRTDLGAAKVNRRIAAQAIHPPEVAAHLDFFAEEAYPPDRKKKDPFQDREAAQGHEAHPDVHLLQFQTAFHRDSPRKNFISVSPGMAFSSAAGPCHKVRPSRRSKKWSPTAQASSRLWVTRMHPTFFLRLMSFMTAQIFSQVAGSKPVVCLLYTSPSPRDRQKTRMPSS